MHYTWNETCPTETGEKVGAQVWHILPPVQLLMPDGAFPTQHVWYAQPGQVLKATNLPLLKAGWTHSIFHRYSYLAIVFVPPLAWRALYNIEILAKFTQQALNDRQLILTNY